MSISKKENLVFQLSTLFKVRCFVGAHSIIFYEAILVNIEFKKPKILNHIIAIFSPQALFLAYIYFMGLTNTLKYSPMMSIFLHIGEYFRHLWPQCFPSVISAENSLIPRCLLFSI
jgi:hypothetical protein